MAKAFIGKVDKYIYGILINGLENQNYPTRPLGHQVGDWQRMKAFKATAKVGDVWAKGRSASASIREFVKLNNATEFYTMTMDTANFKSDSFEIYFKTKEGVQ